MKLSVLERSLFVALFLLIATVCLALLFGYRYSFGQQRVEQRGVVVLHGTQRDLRLSMLGRQQKISLPFVDTNVPFGTHHVRLEKPGYLAQEFDVNVRGDDAALLRIELAPMLLTGQARTQKLEEKDVFAQGMYQELMRISSRSGALMTHVGTATERAIYLPSYLRSRKFSRLVVEEIGEREILLEADGEYFLYSAPANSWKPLKIKADETLIVDQGHLLLWQKGSGILRRLRAQTGDADARPLLEEVTDVSPSLTTHLRTGKPQQVYTLRSGVYAVLESTWVGDLSVRPLPSPDALLLGEKIYPRTQSGYLLDETVLPSPRAAFVEGDRAYIQTEDLSLYVFGGEEGLFFGTKLSAPVLQMVPSPFGQAIFVQTETSLLFCEAKTLSRCDTLAQSALASRQRGVSKEGTYLWFLQDNTLTQVPFFSEES